ncbi:MAG TPA: TetR family transcriptional regulator [Mycobacteriales bacterium]|nr:TetR family transcriptional regulator [Mycobacteriales bacterium]
MSSVSSGGLRERKKAQTRAAFIRAASDLFDRHGYDSVTVEDICAAVEVSPRTFFRYFSAKVDLVVAAVSDLLEELLIDLRARPDSEPPWTSLREVLLATADRIAARSEEFVSLAKVTREAPELVGGNARAFMEWEQQMSAEVARRLDPAARERARLLCGIALTGFRVALDSWVDSGGTGDPRAQVEDNLKLLRATGQRLQKP